MNNSTAQAGFKTFIATLSISLLMFGVFYFLLSSATNKKVDIESDTSSVELAKSTSDTSVTTTPSTKNDLPEVAGAQTTSDNAAPTVSNAADLKDQKAKVFSDLTAASPKTVSNTKAVLGVSDTTATVTPTPTPVTKQGTSSTPSTGSTEITVGLMLSLMALGFSGYIYLRGPRKSAISTFEKSITKRL